MFFSLSKILWFIFNPFNLMLFLIFVGFLLQLLKKKLLAKFFYYSFFLFFIVSSVLPTGGFMIYNLEKYYYTNSIPNEIQGILILSGAIQGNLSLEHNSIQINGNAERLIESIKIINKYPKAKIIFSGGPANIFNQNIIQADLAKEFFSQLGVDTNKIVFESKSQNTYDNIFFSKIIANPQSNEKWLVITSAFHMKRTLNIADKLKWNLIPYAVDFKQSKTFSWKPSIYFFENISIFQLGIHEWLGLIVYYLSGKSSKI